MYAKTVTVTAAELASGVVYVNPTIVCTQQTVREGLVSGVLHPREFQIVNRCGCDVEYNIVSSAEELASYEEDSTNYAFVLLPSLEVLQDEKRMNRCHRFLIRPVAGQVATSDLRCDFFSHSKGY